MDYLPVVGWGIKYGGTAPQRANFFASWGLLGDAPEPVSAYFTIPTMPFIPTMPTFGHWLILIFLAMEYLK